VEDEEVTRENLRECKICVGAALRAWGERLLGGEGSLEWISGTGVAEIKREREVLLGIK